MADLAEGYFAVCQGPIEYISHLTHLYNHQLCVPDCALTNCIKLTFCTAGDGVIAITTLCHKLKAQQ